MTQPSDPVILPIIRRVWPTLLAQEIIGAQPMTGPAGEIFKKKSDWFFNKVLLTKTHYRHFHRVYNRRKWHYRDYLTSLGYSQVSINLTDTIAARQWCRDNLKEGTYIAPANSTIFLFAYERDATLFTLRWSS